MAGGITASEISESRHDRAAIATAVATAVVRFEAIEVAVEVTTDSIPPMSLVIRDCTSPARVRVKIRGALRDELLALRGRHQEAPQESYVFASRTGSRVSDDNLRSRVLGKAATVDEDGEPVKGTGAVGRANERLFLNNVSLGLYARPAALLEFLDIDPNVDCVGDDVGIEATHEDRFGVATAQRIPSPGEGDVQAVASRGRGHVGPEDIHQDVAGNRRSPVGQQVGQDVSGPPARHRVDRMTVDGQREPIQQSGCQQRLARIGTRRSTVDADRVVVSGGEGRAAPPTTGLGDRRQRRTIADHVETCRAWCPDTQWW